MRISAIVECNPSTIIEQSSAIEGIYQNVLKKVRTIHVNEVVPISLLKEARQDEFGIFRVVIQEVDESGSLDSIHACLVVQPEWLDGINCGMLPRTLVTKTGMLGAED